MDKILLTFLVLDVLFVLSGGLILVASMVFRTGQTNMMSSDPATDLLLAQTPLTGATVNAVIIFITFLSSIPSFLMTKNRGFLRLHSWLVIFCAVTTLAIGLEIWISTLKTRSNLNDLWALQSPQMQTTLQQEFNCCGYLNSTSPLFQVDAVCPNTAAAALKPGCVGPFSAFANNLLDLVFTAVFGICALDVMLFLSAIVVLKDRAQKERYRMIDAKSGFGGI